MKIKTFQLILQDVQQTEGSELTKEIYRWDQRLFSVVLRLPGLGGPSTNPKDPLPSEMLLAKLAEATGGWSQILPNIHTCNQPLLQVNRMLYHLRDPLINAWSR